MSLQDMSVSPDLCSRGTIPTSGNCVTGRADAIGRRFHETCFADRFRAVVRDACTDGIGVSRAGYRADLPRRTTPSFKSGDTAMAITTAGTEDAGTIMAGIEGAGIIMAGTITGITTELMN